ncbi:hypothetical protein BDN70DRAFT_885120 [Pholiota conissans]|uniref:DUF8205 domain-containing protein n=1 Tax=Pholiota conissans TaxID=109636 RepID=A0A9P6CPQ0_9AGAR|nr:hypothetical protein BDN70DRAFT_885120 [Pholiota conissans]
MGMLQFSNIAVYDDDDDDDDKPIHPAVQSMWKKARKDLDQNGRTESVIEIVNSLPMTLGNPSRFLCIRTRTRSFRGWQGRSMFIPSGDNSQSIEKPMSALSYVETVNATIRSDKENRWLLRRKMGPLDKQLIIDRAAGRRDSFAAIYSKKLEQQSVYKEVQL